MWNVPTSEELAKLPKLRETENIPTAEKIVGMHFFTPRSVWYMTEYCPNKQKFFGYTIQNFDFDNSDWEYFSFKKLQKLKFKSKLFGMYQETPNAYNFFKHFEIERNSCWTPKKVKDIPYIVKGYKQQGLECELLCNSFTLY